MRLRIPALVLLFLLPGCRPKATPTSEPPRAPAPEKKPPEPEAVPQGPIEASGLVPLTDVRAMTGVDPGQQFEEGELQDLSRTPFYDSVHYKAVGQTEAFDFAYRVWFQPPGGMAEV